MLFFVVVRLLFFVSTNFTKKNVNILIENIKLLLIKYQKKLNEQKANGFDFILECFKNFLVLGILYSLRKFTHNYFNIIVVLIIYLFLVLC